MQKTLCVTERAALKCNSMSDAIQKSRRYKWEQFSAYELLAIFLRLRRELEFDDYDMPTPPIELRHHMEEMIDFMAVEKGKRVAENQIQRGMM